MDYFSSKTASLLRDLLREHNQRIVFAESCTAGLLAASLARIPGISEWLVGSAVVYQNETKAEWLDVDRQSLNNPGPVSRIVSEQMARSVLQKTYHATMSASVTGHLGPNAPQGLDGVAWSSVAIRTINKVTVTSRLLKLDEGVVAKNTIARPALELRQDRQIAAVQQVLNFCIDRLQS